MKYKQTEGGTNKGKEYELSGSCNACDKENCDPYYDSRALGGRWGWYCQECWKRLSPGRLGIGLGQKYEKVA